jgi:hypothetical protein
VSTRNAVLLGARPGQIVLANMRGSFGVREGIASVPFEPVWALPADPLHSDKHTARVIALAAQVPTTDHMPRCTRREKLARRHWCDAILSSARKGLVIEPNEPDITRLWAEYRRFAKAIRKQLR